MSSQPASAAASGSKRPNHDDDVEAKQRGAKRQRCRVRPVRSESPSPPAAAAAASAVDSGYESPSYEDPDEKHGASRPAAAAAAAAAVAVDSGYESPSYEDPDEKHGASSAVDNTKRLCIEYTRPGGEVLTIALSHAIRCRHQASGELGFMGRFVAQDAGEVHTVRQRLLREHLVSDFRVEHDGINFYLSEAFRLEGDAVVYTATRCSLQSSTLAHLVLSTERSFRLWGRRLTTALADDMLRDLRMQVGEHMADFAHLVDPRIANSRGAPLGHGESPFLWLNDTDAVYVPLIERHNITKLCAPWSMITTAVVAVSL